MPSPAETDAVAPVRVVVVGAGQIAQRYYLPLLDSSAETELVGLWDTDGGTIEAVADAHPKAEPPRKGESYEQFLRRVSPGLVVNLTPPAEHFALTREALLAGASVYSEKPLAMSVAEAEELQRIATEHGSHLGVAPYVQGSPLLDAVSDVLSSGELGTVHTAFVRYGCSSRLTEANSGWRADDAHGGVLVDVGVYPFAVLRYLFGASDGVVSCSRSAVRLDSGTAMESWSIGLQYGPGLHAVVQTGTHYGASGFEMDIRLTGTDGELKISSGNLMSLEIEIKSRDRDGWVLMSVPQSDYHWARGPVDLAGAMRTGAKPATSVEAVEYIRVTEQCRAFATVGN